MADGGGNDATSGVRIDVDDAVVRVDVRPHGLIAQLRSSPEAQTTVVAQSGASSAHRALAPTVRQGSFRLTERVTVEATSASDFAAVAHPDGRCLVVAFSGDVVVLPSGEDRFALASHEALLVPAGAGEVKVMATEALPPETQGQVTEMVDHAASLVAEPPGEPAPAPAAAAAPAAEEAEQPAAADAAKAEESRRKKTKKERREEKAARAAAAKAARKRDEDAAAEAAAAAAGGAASEAPAAEAPTRKAEKAVGPEKKPPEKKQPVKKRAADRPPRRRAEEPQPSKVAAAAGATAGAPDEVSGSRGKRGLYVAIAAVILLLLAVVAIGTMDDEDDVATVDPATTLAPATTAAPDTTVPETTVAPTTVAPTTAPPPVASYDFVPRSCVQEGESITYTASITNNATAPFDFVVEVAFKDPAGDTVTTDEVTVTALRPGDTETISASGSVGRDLAGSGATCVVERVEATASA